MQADKKNHFRTTGLKLLVIIAFTVITLINLRFFLAKMNLWPSQSPTSTFTIPTLVPTEKWTPDYIQNQVPKPEQLESCRKPKTNLATDSPNAGSIDKIDLDRKILYLNGKAILVDGVSEVQIQKGEPHSGMLLATPYSIDQVLPHLKTGLNVELINKSYGKLLLIYCSIE